MALVRNNRIIAESRLIVLMFYIAYPRPAQHLFNLLVVWLHQHCKLQVLDGVFMSTKHLLHMNKATFPSVRVLCGFYVCVSYRS